jgi:hypothetical protein
MNEANEQRYDAVRSERKTKSYSFEKRWNGLRIKEAQSKISSKI